MGYIESWGDIGIDNTCLKTGKHFWEEISEIYTFLTRKAVSNLHIYITWRATAQFCQEATREIKTYK